jgi:mannose-6-phosphate isomerase-like protein (cupin superfamily)
MTTTAYCNGKHSAPGQGNIYARANEAIVKITGADTDQTFEVVEENCKPGFQSRAHYHIKAFETFYVFDGSADFQVGDELFHAEKGSCVHIPPGVPHQVTSKDGVRMLMIYSPAGTEGMFAAMHALTQDQLMNAELTKQIALKHDTVMIEQSKDGPGKRHDLGITIDCRLAAALVRAQSRVAPICRLGSMRSCSTWMPATSAGMTTKTERLTAPAQSPFAGGPRSRPTPT